MMRRNLLSESVASASSLPANTVFKLGTNGLVGAQNNIFLDTPTNSRTANTITRYGNVTQGTFTPYSKEAGKWSNYFDGSGNLTAANATFDVGGSYFKFEFDVNFTKIPVANSSGGKVSAILLYSAANNSTGYEIIVEFDSVSGISLTIGAPGSSAAYTKCNHIFTLGKWYNVIIQKTVDGMSIVVDGVVKTLTRDAFNNAVTGASTLKIGAGKFSSGYDHYCNGYISNLKITKAGVVVLDTCKDNRLKDNSGFNHTLTPTGNVKVSPFSPYANSAGYDASVYGGSGYFDGSGDYLKVGNVNAGTGDFSVHALVYLTSYGTRTIVRVEGTYGLHLHIRTTGKFVIDDGYTGGTDSTAVIPLNSWSLIEVAKVGTTTSYYLNGVFLWDH